MRRVWVVSGSTGEYSDRNEWLVAAFASEDAAKARIIALDQRMQEMPQQWKEGSWGEHDGKMKEHMALLDPNFCIDYTGTRYFVSVVPFED